jgi:hypothetical protein
MTRISMILCCRLGGLLRSEGWGLSGQWMVGIGVVWLDVVSESNVNKRMLLQKGRAVRMFQMLSLCRFDMVADNVKTFLSKSHHPLGNRLVRCFTPCRSFPSSFDIIPSDRSS